MIWFEFFWGDVQPTYIAIKMMASSSDFGSKIKSGIHASSKFISMIYWLLR